MIPSEEARRTRRGVRRYFELHGEPIELSDVSEPEDDDGLDDDEDNQDEDYMEGGGDDIIEIED
jgi:hypothetical protein